MKIRNKEISQEWLWGMAAAMGTWWYAVIVGTDLAIACLACFGAVSLARGIVRH